MPDNREASLEGLMENASVGAPLRGARQPFATARMVRPLCDAGVEKQQSFVTSRFHVRGDQGPLTLRISALGLYVAFVNGKRVGQDLLTPGWTCYDARISYQTYDLTELVSEGENRIDIWLGDGWFRSKMMWRELALWNVWGDHIAAIAEIADLNGHVVHATDEHWQSGLLPVLQSGIYLGEVYDARLKPRVSAGCAALDFDIAKLIPHEIAPVRELEPLPIQKSWTDDEGRQILDFGQNSAGYVRFSVRGERGARIRIEHAEVLNEHGQFVNSNLRTAPCIIDYTLAGEGEESYRPFFTFQGFRFARVTISGQAELISAVSVPISSVTKPVGAFECGNPLVNRLVLNTLWSQRANFIEVPTDCPQRDERLGWTGDAQVFASTACYFHDCHDFFVKYIRDVMIDQRPDGAVSHVSPDPTRMNPTHYPVFQGSTGWGDAIEIIPWTLYLHYGDRDILKEALPAMERWVDFVWSISDGPIVRPPRGRLQLGFTFGDWLQPKGPSNKPWPTIGDEAAATIYLYIAASLTARVARLVGEDGVAERLAARAETVKAAYAREFISPAGRLTYDDQTSYALAFLHGLVPDEHREAARKNFKAAIVRTEGRIGTGFIGTPALLPALVEIGETELAGQVFLQEEVPGWLYQVKMGATSIWERWDSLLPDGSLNGESMNSYNHYAYGAVCQWLFEYVAGFRPDPERPAFRSVIFAPAIIPALGPVEAHCDTVSGRVAASWSVEGDLVTYDFEVPPGSTGTLALAASYVDARLGGQQIATGTGGGGRAEVGAGKHRATFRLTSQ